MNYTILILRNGKAQSVKLVDQVESFDNALPNSSHRSLLIALVIFPILSSRTIASLAISIVSRGNKNFIIDGRARHRDDIAFITVATCSQRVLLADDFPFSRSSSFNSTRTS